MRAVVANGPGYGQNGYHIEDDVRVPDVGPGELLIAVRATGLCGSDAKMLNGSDFYWDEKNGRCKRGVIPGHEFVGEVVKVGREGKASVGDLITVESGLACRACWFCLAGNLHKCDSLRLYGQGVNGSMAVYMLVHKESPIHKFPAGVSVVDAVAAEPLSISIHAMDRGEINGGDTVVISGCGAVGIGIIAAIRYFIRGDVKIIGIDFLKHKLNAAMHAGADYVVDLSTEDADVFIKSKTEGRGADCYFECSGHPGSVKNGLEFLRKMGRFIHCGLWDGGCCGDANWNLISGFKELDVVGTSLGGPIAGRAWPRAVEMISASRDLVPFLDSFVTHRFPLEQFELAHNILKNGALTGACRAIKMVLDPGLDRNTIVVSPGATIPLELIVGDLKIVQAEKPIPLLQQLQSHVQEMKGALSGKVVWVTGSSRGIGRSIGARLASEGARVVFHGTRMSSPSTFDDTTEDTQKVDTLEELASLYKGCGYVIGDLTNEKIVNKCVESIHGDMGRIDVLVCCAGGNIGIGGSSGERNAVGGMPVSDDGVRIPLEDATKVMDNNFLTTLTCCKRVSQEMMVRRQGRIVMIGSVAGCIARPKGVMYAVSKAAVHHYCKCLAMQLREFDISVNCIAPGMTVTSRFVRNLGDQFDPEARKKENVLKRYGEAVDTANAVSVLCSADTSFWTGQIVRVDGGATL